LRIAAGYKVDKTATRADDGGLLSNTNDTRRLVIGAAVGFKVDQVRVFVESLRAAGFTGDVVLLVGPLQWRLKRYLARHRVVTVSSLSTRKLHGPIHAYRFERFAKIVAATASRYDQVLVSDTRDVAFQRHPFDGITSQACHAFLEGAGKTIGEEPTNLRWAKIFLSPEEVAKISTCRVSCCGVVLGGTTEMTEYLRRLAGYLHDLPLAIRREGGADTVFHNRMLHLTREVPFVAVENNLHVATMGIERPQTYIAGPDGLIRTTEGHLPAILHQYDRISSLKPVVERRFAP
jgi:hypothetical protein